MLLNSIEGFVRQRLLVVFIDAPKNSNEHVFSMQVYKEGFSDIGAEL